MMEFFSLEHWLNSAVGVLLVGAVGYFLRFLTERSHAIEMATLNKRHEEELRAFGHRFNLLESQAQVTFQAMHPERVKHLTTVFHNLRTVSAALLLYVKHTDEGNKPHLDHLRSEFLAQSRLALESYFKYRFYFSKETCGLIDSIHRAMEETDQSLQSIREPETETPSMAGEEPLLRKKYNILERMINDVGKAILSLEDELRAIVLPQKV